MEAISRWEKNSKRKNLRMIVILVAVVLLILAYLLGAFDILFLPFKVFLLLGKKALSLLSKDKEIIFILLLSLFFVYFVFWRKS